MSLWQSVPQKKGTVSNPATFLPPFNNAQEQIGVDALFSRQYIAGTNRTCK